MIIPIYSVENSIPKDQKKYTPRSALTSQLKFRMWLVRVLWDDRHELNTASRNVGLLYLRDAILHHWWEAEVIHELSVEDAIATLRGKDYNAIGFTVHVLNIEETLKICEEIKKEFPYVYIGLGWHHASWSADNLLKFDYIDSVFIWEWEGTIREFIDDITTWRWPKQKYIPTIYPALDDLSFPRRDFVHAVERIITSRGCPYSCTFCTTPMMRTLAKEPTYRERSAKDVVDEIEYLVVSGAKRIIFNDDLFCINSTKSHQRAREIAEEILKRWIKVIYKVQLRVDSIKEEDSELLQLLYSSGLREVFMGIESGSDKMLDTFQKKVTKSDNFKAIHLYEQYGIKVNAWNILATADSSEEDVCDSIEAFHEVNLAYLLFRRVTTKAIVFPWTQLEEDLFDAWFIESRNAVLPNPYKISDQKVALVVWFLERHLPYFLDKIWEIMFPLRNKALVVHYANKWTQIPVILARWSQLTRNFLIKWFRETPIEDIKETDFLVAFNDYISKVENIRTELSKQVESIPYPDFYADTF